MVNKIEFSSSAISESSPLINQTSAGSSFDQNLLSKNEAYANLKAFKIVKGKVKIFNNNHKLEMAESYITDDNTELEIVCKRMLLFVKFTFLFLLVFSVFMLIYRMFL